MAESVFPIKHPINRSRAAPRHVPLHDAGEVLNVLASDTARAIIQAVADDPTTASDLAERLDMSLQNVAYHLNRLADTGIVEIVDQWYSPRGREMDVYALAAPLVISIGSEPGAASSPANASSRGVSAGRAHHTEETPDH